MNDDKKALKRLGLSYDNAAKLLGTSKQAIQNGVDRSNTYLNTERLTKMYEGLPWEEKVDKYSAYAQLFADRLPRDFSAPLSNEIICINSSVFKYAYNNVDTAWLFGVGLQTIMSIICSLNELNCKKIFIFTHKMSRLDSTLINALQKKYTSKLFLIQEDKYFAKALFLYKKENPLNVLEAFSIIGDDVLCDIEMDLKLELEKDCVISALNAVE